MVEVF